MAVDLEKVKAFLGQKLYHSCPVPHGVMLAEAIDHLEALVAEVEELRKVDEARKALIHWLSQRDRRLSGQLEGDVGGTR